MKKISLLFLFLTALCLALLPARTAKKPALSAELFQQLKYRHIGPTGNRVIAVTGVPGQPDVFYVGAASGGIFKTVDGGINWEPVFDAQPVSSIGSLAVAPSDPNLVWAGTGETFIRSNVSQGDGIYKSTDAGRSWKHMGLGESGRIGRIIIDPRDPDTVFAAVMGHCYGPQQERGVFRTRDGGRSWQRVLFVDENTGCSDLAMDPTNPRIIFAGMWPMLIRTWGRWSGGPGGGLYLSRDGGDSWTRLEGNGLPDTEIGKVALAVAASDPDRVYALIETADEGLWRSDDGGGNWKQVNRDHGLLNRPHYYTRLAVAPDNADELYFPATRFHWSQDGGLNHKPFSVWGGDHHDMWIDPLDPRRMIVGNDMGVALSNNRGRSWRGIELPIAQMYHVATDNQVPYFVYGNRQDGTSYRVPSNSKSGRIIPRGLWHPVGGFESGHAVIDPVDNNIVWSGNYDGMLDRFDLRTMQSRAVSVWPDGIQGWAPADMKYRFQWTFPILISPHDHNRVYVGSQYVHRSTDAGHSWQVISPDLSGNDPEKLKITGGITVDDVSPLVTCTLFALAESPLEEGQLWAGTNDGRLHLSRDGGDNWSNLSANIPGLPPDGTISNIEPSRHNPAWCYISVDLHQVNDRRPYVYKTENYGRSWRSLRADLPIGPLSYAHCLREDPQKPGLLYLGTENAVHVSFDDGRSWLSLQSNLPQAPVHWLTIQEHFSDLVIGTYGRGFWILDDITPLRQLNAELLSTDLHFFAPRDAYRFQAVETPSAAPNDPSFGENPPYGASLHYYLAADSGKELSITIHDSAGRLVRTLKSSGPGALPAKAGLNRAWWDLRWERNEDIKLWTPVVGHEHAGVGPEGWRPFPLGRGQAGPLVAPGVYRLTLKSGEREIQRELRVLKDPNTAGGQADIEEQTEFLLELQAMNRTAAKLITGSELLRKQLADLRLLLRDLPGNKEIDSALLDLDNKLIAFQDFFFPVGLTGSGDELRWPDKFYSRVGFLARQAAQADFKPTSQMLEVRDLFRVELAGQKENFAALAAGEVAGLNRLLREAGIPHILARELTTNKEVEK